MEDVKTDSLSEESNSEVEQTQTQQDSTEGTPDAKAGDKTDPNLLLKSLQEERERRRLAETKVQELEESIASVSADDDEGIASLKAELADVKRKQQRSEVLESYPQMKEIWSDFEEFRLDPENKGMNMKTAAKAFMAEKGLLETIQRPGLQRQTGGTRTPLSTGMSTDDIRNLRENNYRKYLDMIRKGQIKVPE